MCPAVVLVEGPRGHGEEVPDLGLERQRDIIVCLLLFLLLYLAKANKTKNKKTKTVLLFLCICFLRKMCCFLLDFAVLCLKKTNAQTTCAFCFLVFLIFEDLLMLFGILFGLCSELLKCLKISWDCF